MFARRTRLLAAATLSSSTLAYASSASISTPSMRRAKSIYHRNEHLGNIKSSNYIASHPLININYCYFSTTVSCCIVSPDGNAGISVGSGLYRSTAFLLAPLSSSPKGIIAGGGGDNKSPVVQYQCSVCRKNFRLYNALIHHINTRHNGMADVVGLHKDGTQSVSSISSSLLTPPVSASTAGAIEAQSGKIATVAEAFATTAAVACTWGSTAFASSSNTVSTTAVTMAAIKGGNVTSIGANSSAGSMGVCAAVADNVNETTKNGGNSVTTDAAKEKKMLVCSVCQKTFRLEAALIHHYQAKHGMDMSSSLSVTSTNIGGGANSSSGLGNNADGATEGFESNGNAGNSSMTGASGINSHGFLSTLTTPTGAFSSAADLAGTNGPHLFHYHLEVAPNAPEELSIACHHSLNNSITVMGHVVQSSVTSGFVFEDPVVQFVVVTSISDANKGMKNGGSSSTLYDGNGDGSSATEGDKDEAGMGGGSGSQQLLLLPGDPDKDFITVRVYYGNHINNNSVIGRNICNDKIHPNAEEEAGNEGQTEGNSGEKKNHLTILNSYEEELKEARDSVLGVLRGAQYTAEGKLKKDGTLGEFNPILNVPQPPGGETSLVTNVLVKGRLRMVPQYERNTNKFYHYPLVAVKLAEGGVLAEI